MNLYEDLSTFYIFSSYENNQYVYSFSSLFPLSTVLIELV